MRRFFTLLMCITMCYALPRARGQGSNVPPPAPVLGTAPGAPAVLPAQPGQSTQAAQDNETVPMLQYPNNPVGDILALYEKLTGKVLIRDASLATAPSLSVISPKPITKAEAVHLIEASLLLNGYSLVPDSENRVKVLYTAPTGKNPRSEGVPLYANANEIPPGNEVVSYFMQMHFISPADALAIFKGHVVVHSYGEMIEVPNAQALVITENASLIRALIELQELVDVPPARELSQFVTLKHADAERVAETISKLIEAEKGDKQHAGGGGGAAATNPAAAAPGGQAADNGMVAGDVQLVPDARTNRILVITRPANYPYIKNLIDEFDEDVGSAAPVEHPLKYVSAAEVLPVLADSLASVQSEKGTGSGGPSQPVVGGQKSASQQSAANNANTGNSSGGSGSSGTPNEPSDLLQEPEDTGPTSWVVGKTHLIADNKANSIIVIGPPESQEKVAQIIERLDKRPPQVYLSTVIGELQLTNDNELGVDYLKLFNTNPANGNQNGFASSVLNTTTALIDPHTLVAAAAFPATGGLSLYGTIGKNLSVYVHALESTNHFTVLSRPVVYTANNKKAEISSGQRVPYPAGTISDVANTGSNGTALQSNIAYQDVVLKLEVIPLINANNEVNLKIAQVDDSLAGTQTISGNQVPTIATQKIVTTVSVPNGDTVVLGGLITETTHNDVTGIPILMHLPWVGPAFRDTKKSKERDELIIFIQPNVVQTNSDIVKASESETHRAKTGQQAFDFAQPPPTTTLTKAEMESFFPKTTKKSTASSGK